MVRHLLKTHVRYGGRGGENLRESRASYRSRKVVVVVVVVALFTFKIDMLIVLEFKQ